MQKASDGKLLFVRLDHDEEVVPTLLDAVRDEEGTLVIASALGMMHDFKIGYFDSGEYVLKEMAEPVELLSMCGSVSSQGENRVHIHVSLADRQHASIGGHLISGRVWMSQEILLVRLPSIRSERVIDPARKVGILHLISD